MTFFSFPPLYCLHKRILLQIVVALLFLVTASAHSYGLHALEGEPGPVPVFPQIGGAYDITFQARFDSEHHSDQVIFEFHDGSGGYRFSLIQSGSGRTFNLLMHDGVSLQLANSVDSDAFDIGILHNYRVGANATNSWIYRDGALLKGLSYSLLPPNVPRTSQRLGDSTLGFSRLEGAISGFKIKSDASPGFFDSTRYWNYPGQTFGPFTLSFHAIFRNTTASPLQSVIHMYNTNTNGYPISGIHIAMTSGKRMFFTISNGPSAIAAYAGPDAVVDGEWGLWHLSIDSSGNMTVEKHGEFSNYTRTFARTFTISGFTRKHVMFADSTYNYKLHGAVVGLRLDLHAVS